MIITLCNQKGGVSKTTTAAALADYLKLKNYKVLAIDLDSQANLSFLYDADTEHNTALQLITEGHAQPQTIANRPDIIPSDKTIGNIDLYLTGIDKYTKLAKALKQFTSLYDYIVIDTPPALNTLTLNALTAADYVIIPAQAAVFSLQGVEDLADTITAVKENTNPELKVLGILLTRYNNRTKESKEIANQAYTMADALNTTLLASTIREATKVTEAQRMQQSLFEYAPLCNATIDYKNFAEEVIAMIQQ